HAVQVPNLHSHFHWFAGLKSACDRTAAQSHFCSDRDGKKRINHLVPAEQMNLVVPGEFGVRSSDSKGDAFLSDAYVARAPIVNSRKSPATHLPRRALGYPAGPIVIPVEKELSIRRQHFRESSLFARHSRQVAEEFEMLASDAGK